MENCHSFSKIFLKLFSVICYKVTSHYEHFFNSKPVKQPQLQMNVAAAKQCNLFCSNKSLKYLLAMKNYNLKKITVFGLHYLLFDTGYDNKKDKHPSNHHEAN